MTVLVRWQQPASSSVPPTSIKSMIEKKVEKELNPMVEKKQESKKPSPW